MFKRFWQNMNEWVDALSMDDPFGDYLLKLEDRVAKLERHVDSLQIQSRAPRVAPDDRVHQSELGTPPLLKETGFPAVS